MRSWLRRCVLWVVVLGLAQAASAQETTAQDSAAAPRLPLSRLASAYAAQGEDEGLEARVERSRREASRMGILSVEPAATALLVAESDGEGRFRAESAVRMAPRLPAAWGALARESFGWSSVRAMAVGIVELDRHLEASLWWRATAFHVLSWTLVGGGVLFLLVCAAWLAPVAVGALWRRTGGKIPSQALSVLLAAAVGLPAALGEGLVGLGAGAFTLAFACGGLRMRLALVLAALAVGVGIHPLTRSTARWLVALDADSLVASVQRAEAGLLDSTGAERLAATPGDPAVGHALAIWNRRMGRFEEAETLLEQLAADDSRDGILLNGAANLRLDRGDVTGAIDLYLKAAASRRSPEVFFNLAQAYGSTIDLSAQQNTLEIAQSLDADAIRELTDIRGNGRLAIDLGWPVSLLRARLYAVNETSVVTDRLAQVLRRDLARGRLAGDPWQALGGLGVLIVLGLALGRGIGPADGQPARAWPRPVLLLVPGAAGVAHKRPLFGLMASLLAAGAVSCLIWRDGVAADPLVAGFAGTGAFGLSALLALLALAAVTLMSRRGEGA